MRVFALIVLACSTAVLSGPLSAAALVIDDFIDGALDISTEEGPTNVRQRGSMFGGTRVTSISVDRRPTVVTASLVEDGSGLIFSTGTGPLGGSRTQGHIQIRYNSDTPVNLVGMSGFIIEFPSITGTGQVNLNFNQGGFLGSPSFEIDSQTTALFYPLDSVYLGDESLDQIDSNFSSQYLAPARISERCSAR